MIWLLCLIKKNVGDKVFPGEIVFEVQTDKAVVGYEYEDEGILAKILIVIKYFH